MVSCNTAMQLLVPDQIRGRVMSVLLIANVGMLPIGHLLAAGSLKLYWPQRNSLDYGKSINGHRFGDIVEKSS